MCIHCMCTLEDRKLLEPLEPESQMAEPPCRCQRQSPSPLQEQQVLKLLSCLSSFWQSLPTIPHSTQQSLPTTPTVHSSHYPQSFMSHSSHHPQSLLVHSSHYPQSLTAHSSHYPQSFIAHSSHPTTPTVYSKYSIYRWKTEAGTGKGNFLKSRATE